ncbi:NnrU family protein [Octadecabacter sp. G9-8]|uniref:NnrU family protein n=1 Tax=Octadecabacter dasysiphoniae TaxID=2909341 RepID=A0ABS9CRM5_9RHOB|nr:NnrU family protein [Octadecabacter dasysiphoniae]MCF2869591.1 NnrU family protein [Octadecabacter dasysiphoniae]
MTLLLLGLVLWVVAHFFKRVAPDARANLGKKGDAIMGLSIITSVVLMVIGYRAAEGAVFWGPSPAMVGINNLLMILAFYFYAASAAKGAKIWLGTKVRHPQLTGFSIWAVAHLLVNGDVPSFILFGGLLIWAQTEIAVINRAQGAWDVPPRAPAKKEVVAIVITLVVVAVVMAVHYALGVQPWG